MKIDIVKVPRCPPWPLWAVILVLIWLALGCAAVGIEKYLGEPAQLCLFKRLTHIPCPTCGFTRGGLLLLNVHLGQAWRCNPLLFFMLFFVFGITVFRIIFAKTVRVSLTKRERLFAWLFAITLFVINWIYVIACVG